MQWPLDTRAVAPGHTCNVSWKHMQWYLETCAMIPGNMCNGFGKHAKLSLGRQMETAVK